MRGELHICAGPSTVLGTAPDDRATRWCFRCRKHLPHTWELMGDRKPSYYDPQPVCRCSGCGEDHTDHPGNIADGPSRPSAETWAILIGAAT